MSANTRQHYRMAAGERVGKASGGPTGPMPAAAMPARRPMAAPMAPAMAPAAAPVDPRVMAQRVAQARQARAIQAGQRGMADGGGVSRNKSRIERKGDGRCSTSTKGFAV